MFHAVIEKSVPLPEAQRGIHAARPAPFGLDRLEPGDSAHIPLSAHDTSAAKARESTAKGLTSLRSYIFTSTRSHRDLKGRKFATRNDGLGIRIWRLS